MDGLCKRMQHERTKKREEKKKGKKRKKKEIAYMRERGTASWFPAEGGIEKCLARQEGTKERMDYNRSDEERSK
jgi:hypothetical protein